MNIKAAKKLWLDTARFWAERVAECDRQTVEDIVALVAWPDPLKKLCWAARCGPKQVFTSAVMEAGIQLAWLRIVHEEGERWTQQRQMRGRQLTANG